MRSRANDARAKKQKLIGQLLSDGRRASGYSQRDFGALLGHPQAWVSQIETGRISITLPDIEAWCAVSRMSLREFVSMYLRGSAKAARANTQTGTP